MGFYHTAQICLNGHMINDAADEDMEFNRPFCPDCGAETITACPACNAKIYGDYECEYPVLGMVTSVKSYCHNCGKPYPWTLSAIENASLIIREEESFSEDQINNLIEDLPAIITETPSTNLATIRIKKALSAAGRFTSDGIRQFVIDFGCELAKKSIGL